MAEDRLSKFQVPTHSKTGCHSVQTTGLIILVQMTKIKASWYRLDDKIIMIVIIKGLGYVSFWGVLVAVVVGWKK